MEFSPAEIALNGGAAHARVLAEQYAVCLRAIQERYPHNRLGGLVQRLQELALFAHAHAEALTAAADASIRRRSGRAPDAPIEPPEHIIKLFDQADRITHWISVPEAAQLAAAGNLVVLRDKRVQAEHMIPIGAVVFGPEVDAATISLWWPRILSRGMQVALITTKVDGVWIETTYDAEDLPQDLEAVDEGAVRR